jgi:ADP-ribose pyrophosphatase YjhB (NUDIX family)
MSDTICDHTSVGMLVWEEETLLLIERKKFPYGFAPPAGHVDNDPTYEVAAKRELEEEVGLKAETIDLIWEGRKNNQCRRVDGTWHYWKVYTVTVTGELIRNNAETKQCKWFTPTEVSRLSQRTEEYLKGVISDQEWQDSPGIEPVWHEIFRENNLI